LLLISLFFVPLYLSLELSNSHLISSLSPIWCAHVHSHISLSLISSLSRLSLSLSSLVSVCIQGFAAVLSQAADFVKEHLLVSMSTYAEEFFPFANLVEVTARAFLHLIRADVNSLFRLQGWCVLSSLLFFAFFFFFFFFFFFTFYLFLSFELSRALLRMELVGHSSNSTHHTLSSFSPLACNQRLQ
jgi:hypothetical protein